MQQTLAVVLGAADAKPIAMPAHHLEMVKYAAVRMKDTKSVRAFIY